MRSSVLRSSPERLQTVSFAVTIDIQTAVTHESCVSPIRAAFAYIAQTVILLVRPTLHKDLAALCLTDN